MSASRTVFYGFGCYVGQSVTLTQCSWWAQDPTTLSPQYDASKLISTDIGKNPQGVRDGSISAASIQADDAPVNGGLTKVGPTFPSGSQVNGVWIEQAFYNALHGGVKPARIPLGAQCHDYELKTVIYWSGPMASRRFWGVYAEIIAENATQAQCKLWAPGSSLVPGQAPFTTAWLDLATAAHPIEAGFTVIGMGVSNPKTGALFLDSQTMSAMRMTNPKLPPALGASCYPPMPPRR